MEKTKKIKLNTILRYVSLVLVIGSVVAYFLPFVKHFDKFFNTTTILSGYDFTKALSSTSTDAKILVAKSLLETEKTSLIAKVLAYGGPICCGYSVIIFALTCVSNFYPKLNNIFVVGGYFALWVLVTIATVALVGRMAVINGDYIINNYSVGGGAIMGGVLSVIASVINIFVCFREE